MYEPPCPRRTVARLARAGLFAGTLFLAEPPAPAGPPPADAARDAFRDLQLTVHARRALQGDPALAALNVGVRVRGGVATLWGPVPSADLVPKAVKRVESVQGVLGVRSELYVATPEKKFEPLPIPLAAGEPLRTESASPDPVSGALTGRTVKASEVYRDAAAPPSTYRPVTLAPPIRVPSPDPAPAARPAMPAAATTPEPLPVAVDRLRRGDPRFRPLRAEVRGDTVILSGSADRGEDVMALATAVSRLPGVGRVVTKTDAGTAP